MNGFEAALSLIKDGLHAITGPSSYEIAVWFLAGVFTWSGIAKLRRPALAAMAMVDFGVVRRFHPSLGGLLGAAEVFLALMLALRLIPRFALLITVILFWFFVLLIARSLWSNERFACFCFGDADSELSGWTLARTTALALTASTLALTAIPTRNYRDLDEVGLLQGVTALSLLGTMALANYIPRLLRWNHDWLQVYAKSYSGGE
jgi:hypothetical protein